MSFLSSTQGENTLIRPRRSIGGLYPHIVIEETHEDSLEITEHPVEQGAPVTDHAYKKPEMVTIQGGVSDSSSNGSEAQSIEFYDKLRELQSKREPFDIITGKRSYKNMLIESLTSTTDATTENAFIFSAQCRQIIIAKTEVTSVPPRKNHANPSKTSSPTERGQQQPQKRKSMFKAVAGS